MSLRIHCFQHVDFEGLGCIGDWIARNNHQLTYTRFYEEGILPEHDDIDWLIIMGGPMGVYDEVEYPWLNEEKNFIRQAITKGKTVLGICLGAQLIASVLGARVYPNQEREIGWFPVTLTEKAKSDHLLEDFVHEFSVFHWHGDTFQLPEGATHLIKSIGCSHQAFRLGNNVLGLQFHFEVTESSLLEMVEMGKDDLQKSTFVQTQNEILANKHQIPVNNRMMDQILDRLVS